MTFRAQALLTQPTMKSLIFYYKWPRIEEGLVCKIVESSEHVFLLDGVPQRECYVYSDTWYARKEIVERTVRGTTRRFGKLERVSEESVPKEIRIRALVLT